MWLLPALSGISSFALHVFYRLSLDGNRVPPAGPVLLVANHQNSLLDPALVATAAGRPVRFLAKAPLFSDPSVGWLVRASGSVPVYRRADDPSLMDRNDEAFRAAHSALAGGSAIGIFPEGLSHSEPFLAPLKTGAARIALGTASLVGDTFPIVPVGLTFRGKERFRSEALILVGEPVAWHDLAGAGTASVDAARELTSRIEEALRRVTLNLQRWEDAPLVDGAEAIYAAEFGADPSPAHRLARAREVAETLAKLRGDSQSEGSALAHELATHLRILRILGLQPDELHKNPRIRVAAEWILRQVVFFLLAAPLAAIGTLIFYAPYHLTGIVEARARPPQDVRATYKLLVGALLHIVWIVLIALIVGWISGPLPAVLTAVALPPIGLVTLRVFERWEQAVGEARRFLVGVRRTELLADLRARQRALATRLRETWTAVRGQTGFTG